jgi:uncharacterized membrane protein YhfC
MIVSQTALLGLACAALISLLAPFLVYFVCRRRMVLSLRNVALGAGVLVLFALMLESAMHWYILKHNPVTSAWINGHAWGFVAYAAGAAALFEETGRFLAMRLFAKRTGDPGTAVAYGIGHGGIEAILIGALAQTSSLAMAVMLNLGRLDAMLAHRVPPAALVKLHASYAHLDFATALVGGMERVCALLIQIALSLLVWRAVSRKEARWFFAALAAHAGIDSLAAMFQKGMISLFFTESIVAVVGAVLLLFFLLMLPRRQMTA